VTLLQPTLKSIGRGTRWLVKERILWGLAAIYAMVLIYTLMRLEHTQLRMETWAPGLMLMVPQGRLPERPMFRTKHSIGWLPLTVPFPFPSDDPRFGAGHGLLAIAYYVTPMVTDRTIVFLVYHTVVCGVAVWLYRFLGFPPLLGASSPAVARVGSIYVRTFVRSALWSVMWLPLAYLAQTFFSVAWDTPRVTRNFGPVLAVGALGLGSITAGAIVAYILTVSYALRTAVVAEVHRSGAAFLPCPSCGYGRPRSDRGRCPECGQSVCPDRVAVGERVVFALGRRLAAVASGRWRWLPPTVAVAVVVGLYGAPYFLPLLGRALPQSLVDSVGQFWSWLWPWLSR